MAHGRRVDTAGHQACHVCDVGHHQCADLTRDLAESGEVHDARYRGASAENDLRSFRPGEIADLVQVHAPGFLADRVLNRAEPAPSHRNVPAVGQMSTHGKRHPHNGVARLEECQIYRQVPWRTRVRLDVGVIDAEKLLGAFAGQPLYLVDNLLALVVAAPRIAF